MDPETYRTPGFGRAFLVGSYCCLAAALFGGVVVDRIYANALRGVLDAERARAVFSGLSDFFLLLVSLALLAALGAIAGAWEQAAARNLLAASVVFVMAEVLGPFLLRGFDMAPDAGGRVRLFLSGAASVLSLLGLANLYRRPLHRDSRGA